jgi:hypothetical protein
MTVRRMKTYTAETGFVYQYYFVGRREALAGEPEAPATEFIFDVTGDRKTTFAVSIFLKAEALKRWHSRRGRSLTEAEQYGAAKMRLFRGFDQIEDLLGQGRRLTVDGSNVEDLLAPLGLE